LLRHGADIGLLLRNGMIDASLRDAWQALSDRLGAFIARRLPAQDVDDVLQDVLLRIHRNVGRLDDEDQFGPWAYSIARNAVTDHFRKRVRDAVDVETVADPTAATNDDDEPPLLDCVAPFVAQLPSPYREAITLVELQGLTQTDAAEISGVSLSGMKSRVQRGRRMLRAMFEDCCALTLDGRGKVIDADRRAGPGCDESCGSGSVD
jgi:RNA polymerase sigma-70 factor (ECF subfamily)